jgi:hypothetical protein
MMIDVFHLRFQLIPATKQMRKSTDTFGRRDFSKSTAHLRVVVMSHRVASVSIHVAKTTTMPTETVARDDFDAVGVGGANAVDNCYVVVVVVEEDRLTICFQDHSVTRTATSVHCDALYDDRAN